MKGSDLMVYRRKKKRVSQKDVADKLGIFLQTVRDVEKERLELSDHGALSWVETIDAIATEKQTATAA